MNVAPKDALEVARISADYEGMSVAYSSIAQAEALTRLADAVEELVAVVRAGLAVRS